MPDHQQQMQHQAHLPYPVLISADGQQRYAMPLLDDELEEPWPPEGFERLTPVPVTDLSRLSEVTLPILWLEPALAHYQDLKQQQQSDGSDALWQMAQVTWPFQVIRHEEEGEVCYVVYFVHGQGLEEEYWDIRGEGNDEQAVRLSVRMRNLYRAGVAEGAQSGSCYFLTYAAAAVHEVNGALPEELSI